MVSRTVVVGAIAAVVIVAALAYIFLSPGNLALQITDPPRYSADVQHIYVTFTKVEVHKVDTDSWVTVMGAENTTMDLMQIVNVTRVLASSSIANGHYNEIRIFLSSARAVIGGSNVMLTVPSGAQTGLKIPVVPGGFEIKSASNTVVLIDMRVDDRDVHNGKLTPALTARVTS